MTSLWNTLIHDDQLKRHWRIKPELTLNQISEIMGFAPSTVQKNAQRIGLYRKKQPKTDQQIRNAMKGDTPINPYSDERPNPIYLAMMHLEVVERDGAYWRRGRHIDVPEMIRLLKKNRHSLGIDHLVDEGTWV